MATDAGDLLLTFGARAEPVGRTSAAWSAPVAHGESRLRVQATAPGWRGFPLRTVDAARWQIWLAGELYDCAGADIDRQLVEVASGRESAAALNGHFLLVAHDREANRWQLWTDRFGTVHCYLGARGGIAAAGTSFRAVAAAASARALDWRGLTSYFGCGFFLGDRTFFDDVKLVRPATHLVIDDAGSIVETRRYWTWRYRPDRRLTAADAADETAAVLTKVLREQSAGGRVALPISGGLDSRTTVALLDRASARAVWPYSYGYTEDSAELEISGRVAAARGLRLQRLLIDRYLLDRVEHVLDCVEGFQDVTQSRQASIAGVLGQNADRVIAAHWGDVWFDDMGLADARPDLDEAAIVQHAVAKMRKPGSDWLLDQLCAPHAGGESPAAMIRGDIATEIAATAELGEPDARIKAFKTEQWSFRWTLASLRMFQAAAYPRLPFYDARVADVFARIPSALLGERAVQVRLLKRHAPDLARITWQAFDANLYTYRYMNSLLLPKRIVKKALRMLSKRAPIQRNWEVQFADRAALDRALLRPSLPIHELIAPARIREHLGRRYDERSAGAWGYTTSMLLSFSAWLERFA